MQCEYWNLRCKYRRHCLIETIHQCFLQYKMTDRLQKITDSWDIFFSHIIHWSTCRIFVDPQLKFCIFCFDRTENLYGLSRRCHLGPALAFTKHPKRRTSHFCALNPSFDPQDCCCFLNETSDWHIHAGNWRTWKNSYSKFFGSLKFLFGFSFELCCVFLKHPSKGDEQRHQPRWSFGTSSRGRKSIDCPCTKWFGKPKEDNPAGLVLESGRIFFFEIRKGMHFLKIPLSLQQGC